MSPVLYLFLQIAVKALSGLLALFALVAAGALFLRKARVSALARLKKGVLLALLICAVVATDWAQKGVSRMRSAPAVALTEEQIAAGFVFQRAEEGGEYDFNAPSNAFVHSRWSLRGAFEDMFSVANLLDGAWFFPFGTTDVRSLVVTTSGAVLLDPASGVTNAPLAREYVGLMPGGDVSGPCRLLAPFRAPLSFVPRVNWPLLPTNAVPSRFWWAFDGEMNLILTWQNVLLGRDTNSPLSVQLMLDPSGRFEYRYDLSRLAAQTAAENALVGAFNQGHGEAPDLSAVDFSRPFALLWHPLSPADTPYGDRDGDGLTTAEEIFIHLTDPSLPDSDFDGVSDGAEVAAGTDPLVRDSDGDTIVDGSDPDPAAATPLLDADGDGLPDAYESFWFGGTNVVDDAASRDGTGFTVRGKYLVGMNPTNAASRLQAHFGGALVSWRLWDAFAADWPMSGTNLVYERTFPIRRTNAAQEFFLSAKPDEAGAWSLTRLVLEWEDSNGKGGSVTLSPAGDSWRIPLEDDFVDEITIRLRAVGGGIRSATALHLVGYAPIVSVAGGAAYDIEGERVYVFTEGTRSRISISLDTAHRPCAAASEAGSPPLPELDFLDGMSDGLFAFSRTENGGEISARGCGEFWLPQASLDVDADEASPRRVRRRAGRTSGGGARVVVCCPSLSYGRDCNGFDDAHTDAEMFAKEDEIYYPLDTTCLWKVWHHGAKGNVWCDCVPEVGTGFDGGELPPGLSFSMHLDGGRASAVLMAGTNEVWSATAEHMTSGSVDWDEVTEAKFLSMGACEESDCSEAPKGCISGSCRFLEGASLGSLQFRIPVGLPRGAQVSGFVYLRSDGPVLVSPSVFGCLFREDADVVVATNGATRHVVCSDTRGCDLLIEAMACGSRITVRDTASQRLEHTWEITNVDGDAARIRLRKISRRSNVMEDWTYVCADGDWTVYDNIAGTREVLARTGGYDSEDGTLAETRTKYDSEGNVLACRHVEKTCLGEPSEAFARITYEETSTGRGTLWQRADYWEDIHCGARNGRLRLVTGTAGPWHYHVWDENGRETLRLEQRNGSRVPDVFPEAVPDFSARLSDVDDAFLTVFDYGPLAGDDDAPGDRRAIRRRDRYVVSRGGAVLVERIWHRLSRGVAQGYGVVRRESMRACSPSAAWDDPANAVSWEVRFENEGADTPLMMRGATAAALDEDGVYTTNAYCVSEGVLVCTSRKSLGGVAFPTYEVTEKDADHGTLLRRATCLTAGDVLLSEERSTYDEKNRLRATSYSDGTSMTNAFSCCRLLWTQDREGRRRLRSGVTGHDHLYNAFEDVYLADLSTNGQFRVTQHFCDALGRETNTVVYAGTTPGEAVDWMASSGRALSTAQVAYPYGGDDYSIRTDERGKVTVSAEDGHEDRTVRAETTSTNGVAVLTTRTTAYRNGAVMTRREWDGNWTEERRFDDYAADGRRVAYVVTESSDCGIVTNRVTTYDFLGRAVSVETPLGVTSNCYDGATSRVLNSTYSAGDVCRRTSILYDDLGEQVGTVQDCVTNRADVVYELFSNRWWRVTRETTVGPSTNAWAITRERLTGLSDGVRSQAIRETSAGDREERVVSLDAATGLQTETACSARDGISTQRSYKGIVLSEQNASVIVTNSYDAFGRLISIGKGCPESGEGLEHVTYAYSPVGDCLAKSIYTNGTDCVTETYAYDASGNRVAATDALGNTICRAYDPFGNMTAEWGATYPVRNGYDTAGRRIRLATTRDGVAWDETRWAYDAATGLCTAKTYADGSTVTYTYTPDGLPLRTTYASGRWVENVYDARRRLVGVLHNDGRSVTFARDAYGRETAAANENAVYAYALDHGGAATNETVASGGIVQTLLRGVDGCGRLASFAMDGGYAAQTVGYRADGRIGCISNADVVVDYAYSADGQDIGYTLAVVGGATFTRTLTRDPYRRDLVLNVANSTGGNFVYAYDALSRPVTRNGDVFGYNNRSEVVSSRRGAESAEAYAYDEIGNLRYSTFNFVTNTYTANSLNQYASILRASAPPRETNPSYDTDGNMITYGPWTYTYDSANRLVSVSSNGVLLVTNFYDAKSRRVKKVTPTASHTFVYDGWNLIEERVAYTNGTISTIHYYWGKDLSGTLQGAGGIGGLLYLTVDGAVYIPCYDNNGNVMRYLDATGVSVASYTYDAFGRTISQSGSLADVFRHRFSTKYFDGETGLYYYGYRFYHPGLMRWVNRDTIEEQGGENLYSFCRNNAVDFYDKNGCAYFAVRGLGKVLPPLKWSSMFISPFMKVVVDVAADLANVELLHEQLFFEDASNVGWGNDDAGLGIGQKIENEPTVRYVKRDGGYNDCVMRKAMGLVTVRHYQLTWFGAQTKCNCQDYADMLRAKYWELINDPKVRCECRLR